jgi:prepilin-type N-terminal cleavage/methylation domain-containing protein
MSYCGKCTVKWNRRDISCHRKSAFTLIELLIVIVMISILSTPTVIVIYTMHTAKGGEIDAGQRAQLRNAANAVIKDIKNAGAIPGQLGSFKASEDTLILRRLFLADGAPEYIIYYVKDSVLRRRVVFAAGSGQGENETTLAENVKKMKFSKEGRLISFSIDAGFTYAQRPYNYSVSTSVALPELYSQ